MTSPKHILTHEHFTEDVEEQVDPHGFSKGHKHGHVVLSVFTLRTVLATLLLFTALTVAFAQGEKWFDATFSVTLPHWVNIVVAMSIATLKSVIVAAFFMQLKYDNPINTAIFMFCLLALALFLGFTALDLGMRGEVYAFKAGEIERGGTGNIQRTVGYDAEGNPIKETITIPIYKFAGEQLKKELRQKLGATIKDAAKLDAAVTARFDEIRAEVMAHGHHGPHAAPGPTNSTPNQSRPRAGTTPGLFDAAAPAASDGATEGAHH